MNPIEVMKIALKALELSTPAYIQECYEMHDKAIVGLKSAIAEYEAAEPVGWLWIEDPYGANEAHFSRWKFDRATPLYTHPESIGE